MRRGKDASAEYGPSQEANSGREPYPLKGYGVTGELVDWRIGSFLSFRGEIKSCRKQIAVGNLSSEWLPNSTIYQKWPLPTSQKPWETTLRSREQLQVPPELKLGRKKTKIKIPHTPPPPQIWTALCFYPQTVLAKEKCKNPSVKQPCYFLLLKHLKSFTFQFLSGIWQIQIWGYLC